MNRRQEINIINDATFQALLRFTPFVTNFPVPAWARDEDAFPCKQHSQVGTHPLSWELIQSLAAKHGVPDYLVDDLYHSEITCTCAFVVEDAYYV